MRENERTRERGGEGESTGRRETGQKQSKRDQKVTDEKNVEGGIIILSFGVPLPPLLFGNIFKRRAVSVIGRAAGREAVWK